MLRHNDEGYNLEILETDQMMPESNEKQCEKGVYWKCKKVKKIRNSS